MTASPKWMPTDDELDVLARTLAPHERDADRTEQARTSLLASAATRTQRARSSRAPAFVGAALALAAAAAVMIWIVGRPAEPNGPKDVIAAIGTARFERVVPWPDCLVRVDDGLVSIQIAALDPAERFRARTQDAELETRGGRFVVGVTEHRLASVAVHEGLVELRWMQQAPVFLAAGQTWRPVRTAHDLALFAPPPAASDSRHPPGATPTASAATSSSDTSIDGSLAPARSAISRAPQATPPGKRTKATPVHDAGAKRLDATSQAAAKAERPTEKSVEAPPAPRPGEADFRAGVAALRSGDAAAATRAFAAACAAAGLDALGEDACFWVGAAAKRAGQTVAAREALTRFLDRFPRSARSGEAAALLGWMLYDTGDLAAAEKLFVRAAADPVPKVRASAERGREAIKRKRTQP